VNERAAIETAARLEQMGIEIRSAELVEKATQLRDFNARGGNRVMRSAAKRAKKVHP
jgi:hypothetical protein